MAWERSVQESLRVGGGPCRSVRHVLGIITAVSMVGAWALSGCSAGDVDIEEGSVRKKDIKLSVGNVVVGRDCRIEGDIVLTAGNVEIGSGTAVTGDITVTHGNVELDEGVHAVSITVKNGTIDLGAGAEITGPVTLTNGVIDVRGAHLQGLVRLKRGRLEVGDGSVLAGGLEVENSGRTLQDSSYVIIGSGARVTGLVTTRGIVRLRVSAQADTRAAEFRGNSPEIFE